MPKDREPIIEFQRTNELNYIRNKEWTEGRNNNQGKIMKMGTPNVRTVNGEWDRGGTGRRNSKTWFPLVRYHENKEGGNKM